MKEGELRNLISINMARLLFIVIMIFGVWALTFREAQNNIRPVDENPVLCKIENPVNIQEKPLLLPEKSTALISESSSSSTLDKEEKCLFYPIILEAAGRYHVDPSLVRAIIMAESEYNPRAISRKGAKGLMQLMPKTAKELGVEDIFDPEHNINGGVKYFRQLLDQFDDDVKLALAAYNAGSTRVRKYKGVPPIKETRYYLKKVFRYHDYYKKETVGDASNNFQRKPTAG